MQQEILLTLLNRSLANCNHTFKDINAANMSFRLSKKTATLGFILRHIAETTNMLCQFFGVPTDVQGTTMNQTDTGQKYDLETSRTLLDEGYKTLETIIRTTPDQKWMETIETSFFGTITRTDLLGFILFHNSHHCGQIASAIVKGNEFDVKSLILS